MKKSKVTNVQASGNFKELFVFEVEFENGDVGKLYRKSEEHKLDIGQELEYTLNDRGSIKIQQPAYTGGGGKKYDPEAENKKQILISRQSSVKAAVDFCRNQDCSIDIVLENAAIIHEWQMTGKIIDVPKMPF
ncbi:MAG: hypothetical protein Unbinned4585contig1001_48 [Prokaryotic dsDNA virus sp.]|nr:MAG: hypothetical protein Unbinned4585contig1001_48 [Prokaryotic dsDNA virus sp.]|tara:strand:+ start:9237 stop:9635 length:399 start_codon:yes stop_codon:yes gene_type:complete